jgi:hypothetical protein
MSAKSILRIFTFLLLLTAACVEPFDFPVSDKDVGFLVVNGFINASDHSAAISLSRAIPLSSTVEFPREINASVSIEKEGGSRYVLYNLGNGLYGLTHPDFVTGNRFRLHIKTGSQKEYYSQYITTLASPPIDSLSWTPSAEGITIKLDSEDPTHTVKYFRWEYIETWQYDAAFSSEYKLINGIVEPRPESEAIKTCYATEPSSEIITNSTMNFVNNKFVDQEISFIPALSVKTRLHYSILVRQFALSEQGYTYWQQLEVNTESLGGLFDPQPAQLRGNISRADDVNEPVIGYFDGGTVSEKRMFIRHEELPDYLLTIPPNPDCTQDLIPLDSVHKLDNFHLLTHAVYWDFILVGYDYTELDCADCRRQGGTTEKPPYWED